MEPRLHSRKKGVRTAASLPVNVLILYEDFSVGTAAREMCDRWIGELAPRGMAGRTMWKFEALQSSSLQALMADDAELATIVVVAAEEGIPLPGDVRHWLELVLTRKAGGALVALLQRREGTDPRAFPVLSFLSVLARQTGLAFHGPGETALLPGLGAPVRIAAPKPLVPPGLALSAALRLSPTSSRHGSASSMP